MTSFIIISPDKSKRLEYIQKYCKDLSINPFDITTIEKETNIKKNVNSIGIEDIKNLHKKLHLKPIKSPAKAVVIEDAQFLTPEAQNALLKVLEEPPANTVIMLSSTTIEAFLPTIISRCKTIELEAIKQKLSAKEIQELNEFINTLPTMPVSEKFKKAELLSKDKEKAIEWIEKIIHVLRDKILNSFHIDTLNSPNTQGTPNTCFTIKSLKNFQSLHTLLKTTNTNPRFAIESTLLAISH